MKTILVRAFNKAGMWFLIIVSCFVVLSHTQPEDKTFERTPAKGTYLDVLSKNTCKDTVEGQFPTGVIVRKIGGGFYYSAKPEVIGKALDEQFAGKDWHGHEVRNFCK